MKESNKKIVEWYDNPNLISSIAIGLPVLIIVLSQSFAVKNDLSTNDILRNLLNHNTIYLIGLLYFVPLKSRAGKKYFNYFNLFFIVIYALFAVTSLLSIIRSFGLTSLVNLGINLVFLVYMVHVFLKNTRFWKELKLEKSPFNEISNDNYFYTILLLSLILFMIDLIESANFDGVVLSLVGMGYTLILARYIYLYEVHLNEVIGKQEKNRNDIFYDIDKIDIDFPKIKKLATEVAPHNLNGYQVVALTIFGICFIAGVLFGNLFPSCGSTSNLYNNTCTSTEFNFSLMICIWLIGFLVCVFFYGIGHIISLLESINHNLEKKKNKN